MSLSKTMENEDVRQTSQIIYNLKGLYETDKKKCKFYQVWVILSKLMGI